MSGPPGRRRLAIAFDKGSVSAREIVRSLPPDCEVTFVLADTPYAHAARGVLECAGEVVPAADWTVTALGRAGRTGAEGAACPAESVAVVTFSEAMLPYCTELAQQIGAPFHDAKTLTLLTNKFAQRERLRQTGVEPTASVQCSRDELVRTAIRFGQPCVLKPARGQASRETFLITSLPELDRLNVDALQASEWVVEQFLVGLAPGEPAAPGDRQLSQVGVRPRLFGDYVSVESICTPTGVQHLAVTGKYPFLAPFREVGQYWPARLEPAQREEVEQLATAALNALGVTHGLTHTEIKLTASGPRIIEVNGRLGGHLHELYLRAADLDLARIAIELALGRTPQLAPTWRDGVSFQYNSPAPTTPARYLRTRDAREVRRVPGVQAYRTYPQAGEQLPGGSATEQLDLLSGWAPDYATMVKILDEAISRIHHCFIDEEGREVELDPAQPWHDSPVESQTNWRRAVSH